MDPGSESSDPNPTLKMNLDSDPTLKVQNYRKELPTFYQGPERVMDPVSESPDPDPTLKMNLDSDPTLKVQNSRTELPTFHQGPESSRSGLRFTGFRSNPKDESGLGSDPQGPEI